MNATVTMKEEVRKDSLVREIPLDTIQESKTNPRTHFDERALAELAANIKEHGVLQPVLLRPRPNGASDSYELVVGSRRYRASKLTRRETIPATIRELNDTQVVEIQLVENLLREGVHELDEAGGYAALQKLNPNIYTVETIALKVSRSPAYVHGRLQLLNLVDEAQQAFRAGKLTVSHAFEMARLTPKDQQRALRECFPEHRNTAAILKDAKAEAVTVRELRAWIEREVHLDLANAPFDPQDAALLSSAGSCAKCPKRTGNNPLLFPETSLRKSTCIDRDCFRAKVAAFVQIRVKPLETEGEKVLRVSQASSWQTNGRAKDVLYEGQYRSAKAKTEYPNTKAAVLVDGRNAGSIFYLCQTEKCDVHNRVTRYEPTPQEKAQRKKAALAERIERQSRVRILDAIRKKLRDVLSRPDLEMVCIDYFRRLGHDNNRRLSKVYGWEEKKSKAAWGGETVDYEKIAASAMQGMSTADLRRLLVVCALVSDLYRSGYDPKQSLAKDSNLALTAIRYKLDSAKIATAVRAELSKQKTSHRSDSKGGVKRVVATTVRPKAISTGE